MTDVVANLKQKLTVLETEYNKNLTELQTFQTNHNKLIGKIEVLVQLIKEATSDTQVKENNNLKLAE